MLTVDISMDVNCRRRDAEQIIQAQLALKKPWKNTEQLVDSSYTSHHQAVSAMNSSVLRLDKTNNG